MTYACPRERCPATGNCQSCPLMARDVPQHRSDPDCWCGPVQHPSGAWDHR